MCESKGLKRAAEVIHFDFGLQSFADFTAAVAVRQNR